MKDLSQFSWNRPRFLLVNFGLEALGVRQLASFLKQRGCSVHTLFLRHAIDDSRAYAHTRAVGDFVRSQSYDIVGLSCMTGDYFEARSISQLIGNIPDRPLVVWGGVHPTILPAECLQQGGADIVFSAAAEEALAKLLSGADFREVPNIAWAEDGAVVNKYAQVKLLDPDSQPFPDFNFPDHFVVKDGVVVPLDLETFRQFYPWRGTHYYGITARGCPYNCAYCCNIYRGKLQRKSVDYFLAELEYVRKQVPFVETLSIQDDSLFLHKNEWIVEFAERYARDFNRPFRAALMPRFATVDKLDVLSKAGLTYVGVGLQGSDRLNREIYGRNETGESFLKAVHNCRRFGITARVDVIVDNPYEEEDDLVEVAHTLNEVPKPFAVSVYSLTLFPGSTMTLKAQQDGVAHLFSGDPYEPGLGRSKTKAGAYTSPEHWKALFSSYLPNLPRRTCSYLIDRAQGEGWRKRIVRFHRWPARARKVGEYLRATSPRGFDSALRLYRRLSA